MGTKFDAAKRPVRVPCD